MKSIAILFIAIIYSIQSIGQNTYVYIDITPNWHENSYNYWTNTKAYNNKTRDLVIANLASIIKDIKYDFFLSLKEELHKQAINIDVVENPTALFLYDNDTYLEILVNIPQVEEEFPFYYKNRMVGDLVISLELSFYDGLGKKQYEKTIPVDCDLKAEIWPEVTSRTSHDQAIEGFALIIQKATMESMPKIINEIAEKDFLVGSIDNTAFNKEMSIRYERKKADMPNHYAAIVITGVKRPIVKTNSNVLNDSQINEKNAAYGNSTIAIKLASALKSVNNYGLFIGVNEYQDPKINDLDNPINDAHTLSQVLTDYYTFKPENITFLENPTRAEIINELDKLARIVDEKSNLLIFYAGHGLWDEQLEKGYWIPSDGTQNSRANWLSNNDLVDYVGGIRSKHTLLITDACFSGSIFKTREIFTGVTKATLELYKYSSKKALTSGAMKSVPDKSVFLEYLVKRLIENNNPFLSSEELYTSFKSAVVNNSPNNQIPQFGVIQGAGDEGGDFIFILK